MTDITFCVGEKVVHVPEGVCVIEEITTIRNRDSIDKEYYKLVPVMDKTSAIYVSIDTPEKYMRKLKSKKEIQEILETQKKAKPLWDANEQRRIQKRRTAMQEDDGMAIAKLIKAYRYRREKEHLSISDRNWLKTAEQFWFSEVAEVLGMDYETAFSVVLETDHE